MSYVRHRSVVRSPEEMQPFLTPVPPVSSDILANVLLPFGYIQGVIRTAFIVVLGALYALLVGGVCTLLVSKWHAA